MRMLDRPSSSYFYRRNSIVLLSVSLTPMMIMHIMLTRERIRCTVYHMNLKQEMCWSRSNQTKILKVVGVRSTLKLSWHVVPFLDTQVECSCFYLSGLSRGIIWCRIWFVQPIARYRRTCEWLSPTSTLTSFIVFKDSEEHSDILTNLQASQSHLDFINTGFLRALDSLPSSITSTLETAPPPHLPSMAVPQTSDSTTVNASTGEKSRPTPKKVRMSRVPAGVIPGVTPPPDPERWLKKSERSTYGQGKKRKGPLGGGGATQGSASVDSPVTAISHPSKTGGGKGKKKR